jgi:SpoVK/Ycf46/Vps4 family AAA+-type ATPase
MTNAIQNILLEEMETFGGILIGTTNLTRNMDPAFERRWTMKLHFEAPNEQAIAAIWKSHIKGLRQTEAVILASQNQLTPGEIFNVGRRYAVERLLGLEDTRLKTLLKLCDTERYEAAQTARNPLGFNLPDRQEMGMREKKAG